jgi:hypothetical protein
LRIAKHSRSRYVTVEPIQPTCCRDDFIENAEEIEDCVEIERVRTEVQRKTIRSVKTRALVTMTKF